MSTTRDDISRRWVDLREEMKSAPFSRKKEIVKELRQLLQDDATLLQKELSLRTR